MFCRTCGNGVVEGAVVCVKCGVPPMVGKKHCQNCGVGTNPEQTVCVKCGVPLRSTSNSSESKVIVASNPPKEPVLMAFLSVGLPGLGQVLLGQTAKGVTILTVSIVLWLLSFFFGIFLLLPFCCIPIIPIVPAIDAFLIAKKLQAGESVREWTFF